MENEYFETNRKLWNAKTPIHLASDFYEQELFMNGKSTLKPIEIDLLGEVMGKHILHLQCHFGQDTLSLSRLGAIATGLDISDEAISQAKRLNDELGLDAKFVCCNLYDAEQYIDQQFDVVFTSYGTIGWLPDLDRWAAVVKRFLKPGGEFVFVDLHPFIWMYDEHFEHVIHPYFNRGPIIETSTGTYAAHNADIEMKEVGWNHPVAEVLTALLDQGLALEHFSEYDHSPHPCFRNMIERAPGEFILERHQDRIPMTYALKMRRSAT